MASVFRTLFFVGLGLLAAAGPAAAKRVALVIGNNAYAELPRLKKAVNDARSVATALEEIGFEVSFGHNLTRRQTNRKLADFETMVAPGDEVFFFFAGHGVALGGENFLIPTDMPEPRPGDDGLVRDEGHAVGALIRRIKASGATSTFFVLDACRDNPFASSGTRSTGRTRGLTRVTAPSGFFVLFSAGVGQTALDRLSDADPNPNSVFTRKLLPLLRTPGLTHVRLAKRLQQEVSALAKTVPHRQQPAYYDEIIGEIVLRPEAGGGSNRDKTPAPRNRMSEAAEMWSVTKDTESIAVLEAFIKQFPGTGFAILARARIEELKAAKPPKVATGIFPSPPKEKPRPTRSFKPGSQFRDCSDCPEMVVLPSGSFMMGSTAGASGRRANEGPQHFVTISSAFAVGKHEVTVGEFSAFVSNTGYGASQGCKVFGVGGPTSFTLQSYRSYRDPGFAQSDRHPAGCISWHDAKAYVDWLNAKGSGGRYRLLSEAEWEYAARAGSPGRFSFAGGDAQLCSYGNGADLSTSLNWRNRNCSDGVGNRTSRVGRYAPNGFGLHDMHGNLWEWVEDCYLDGYYGAPNDGSAMTGSGCDRRVLRGGGWNSVPSYLRSAVRDKFDPSGRYSNGGFRVAKTLSP